MPSPYSSQGSIDDALALSRNLGIKCLQIPIANAFEAFKGQFREIFAGMPEDTTEENMQSRLRGMILMSLSNKFGHICSSPLETRASSPSVIAPFTATWRAASPSSATCRRRWFTTSRAGSTRCLASWPRARDHSKYRPSKNRRAPN